MKKIVGVVPLYDTERESLWMIPGYMQMIEDSGAVPIMLPLTEDKKVLSSALAICSGVLLTGGQDVSPHIYGDERINECGESCDIRDKMEGYILDFCVKKDLPVLGICRGIQFMNAYFGGTLYQDLPKQHPSLINHHMSPPYDRAVHNVTVLKGTPLYKLLKRGEIAVNSYHHQAIKKLAPNLSPMAVSEDGLTEGVYMPGKTFIWAVQWHPELFYKKDKPCAQIAQAFISAL